MSTFDPVSEAAYFASIWKLSNSQMKKLEEAFTRLQQSSPGPSMWATVVVDDFDGSVRWDCRTEGDMGDGDSLPVIELAADTFPTGTRLEIIEP